MPNTPYPCSSIRQRLTELAQRPGFQEELEMWRHRRKVLLDPHSDRKTDKVYRDIYDGEMWEEFQEVEEAFLSAPGNLALMLNVVSIFPFTCDSILYFCQDWFQPYEVCFVYREVCFVLCVPILAWKLQSRRSLLDVFFFLLVEITMISGS